MPSITSATTGRPEALSTPLGFYIFKHIKKELFFGYQLIDLGSGQSAFIASAEKALFDLLSLTPGSDNLIFLRELRLQNVESLNTDLLLELARKFESQKLRKAAQKLKTIAQELKQS